LRIGRAGLSPYRTAFFVGGDAAPRAASMPSLLRFLTVIGIIFGIGYAAIYSLATFIDPKPREITITVPPDKFVKQQH
jgi:hypothetical protein